MSAVFIPEEAKPYCNHMGIINWKKVTETIRQVRGIESYLESGYQLSLILGCMMEDKHGALPVMRSLKLDQVISARMFDKTHPHFIKSKALAEKFAADFGIDISQIPGTGPDGMVLKRDVVTFIRLRRVGKIAAIQPPESDEDGEALEQDSLQMEQSELIKSQRLALDAAFEVTAEYRAQIDALQARVSQLESREVQVSGHAPRQIHITLNLDGALA